MLWNGTKLFLREENPVYIDFIKMGFYIYSVQSDLSEASLNTPLTRNEILSNRKLLINSLSEISVNKYYQECFF